MRQIPLTRGLFAFVDDEDFDFLSKFKWYAQKGYEGDFYAARRLSKKEDAERKIVFMHRFITKCPVGKYIDHKDHNKLNNRKDNLRICSNAENGRNQLKSQKRGSSIYKGVDFDKSRNIWRAQITKNYKNKCIGRYNTEEEAALAYNKAAIELHGEFANLNVL